MARGRALQELKLTTTERERLLEWTRRHKSAQALALRSRIVLAAADGHTNRQIARQLRVTGQTVGKWRSRFLQRRLDGLLDEPRPGAPRRIGDAEVEAVIARTLHERPEKATHWSSRLMADASGLSQSAVVRIWRAFGLQPHRTETFKLSTDPLFIEKVRDIVGLYLNPPTQALVLCVDEKSQIQALDRTQPALPMMPGAAGTAHARLPAPRHDHAVRRARYRDRRSHRRTASPPSQQRVPEVPAFHRGERARDTRHASGDGQLRHTQDRARASLVGSSSALSCALHANVGFLDQPGRTLLRQPHATANPSRHAPLDRRTRTRDQKLLADSQPRSTSVRLDQDRRPDLRWPQALLHANFQLRTLAQRQTMTE